MADAHSARHPSLAQGAFDLQMKVSNYFQVQAAYGDVVADELVVQVMGRFKAAFGEDATRAWATVRRDEPSLIAASAWDERLCCPGPEQISPERLAHSRIAELMAEPIELDGHWIVPSVSASLRRQRLTYDSHEFLGDGYCVRPPGGRDWAQDYRSDMAAAAEMVRALKESRLRLATQPIRDFEEPGNTLYSECFLRGLDRDGNLFAAGVLVPSLERIGVVRQLDRAIVMTALDLLKRYPSCSLGVNISWQSATLDCWWWDIFERLALAPDLGARLVIEITPNQSASRVRLGAFSDRIGQLGCRIALDGLDFDNPVSATEVGEVLCPDFVKLCPEFLWRAGESRVAEKEYQLIAAVAREIGPEVIATGIEMPDHSRIAREAGVNWQQGYLIQAPSIVRKPARSNRTGFPFAAARHGASFATEGS